MRILFFCLTAGLALAAPAGAQVIEIGDDGVAATFDRPTVFTAETATPVTREPRSAARSTVSALGGGLAGAARAHGLAPGLLEAVAWQESRGRQSAVSIKGAVGVMQLMPGTAAELGVDPWDETQNITGGARYLRRQLDRFGSVALALAAYNAGPGAVSRYGGIPPYRETRNYVAAILSRWRPQGAPAAAAALPTPFLIEVTGL